MPSVVSKKFKNLLNNSRFWILAFNVTLSVNIAGFIQLLISDGTLQTIRIEQTYGFLSLLFLYVAILASPLTKVFPNLSFKEAYLHARRAIGVSAFYYAFLHVYISFFKQLSGFAGIKYLDTRYSTSNLFGTIALGILFIMASTSIDWIVDALGFKNWKLLHRLVYFACVAIIIHIVILGPHYNNLNILSITTVLAVLVLVVLEAIRIYRVSHDHRHHEGKKSHD